MRESAVLPIRISLISFTKHGALTSYFSIFYLSVSVSMSVPLSLSLFISLSLGYIHLSIYPPLSPSAFCSHQSLALSLCISLSIFYSVSHFVPLSLSVCLSIFLSFFCMFPYLYLSLLSIFLLMCHYETMKRKSEKERERERYVDGRIPVIFNKQKRYSFFVY